MRADDSQRGAQRGAFAARSHSGHQVSEPGDFRQDRERQETHLQKTGRTKAAA
jgi:hypothetical protein